MVTTTSRVGLATTVAYCALVGLSVWVGVWTGLEENGVVFLLLFVAPHVALGVVAALAWRMALLLVLVPVAAAVPFSRLGCGEDEFMCLQPLALPVFLAVAGAVGAGVALAIVGLALVRSGAAVSRSRSRRRATSRAR